MPTSGEISWLDHAPHELDTMASRILRRRTDYLALYPSLLSELSDLCHVMLAAELARPRTVLTMNQR